MTWKQDVNRSAALDTARALGLDMGRQGSFGPCPVCGAEDRGDGRLPLGARGHGWQCWRPGCKSRDGARDSIGLVAAVELGTNATRQFGRHEWDRVQARAAASGLCSGEAEEPPRRRRRRTPAPSPPVPPFEELQRADLARPMVSEVRKLWSRCRRVDGDVQVARWLESREIDPSVVAEQDLARALPVTRIPPWAACGRAPWPRGWRCIVPAYGPSGALVRLRARWVGGKVDWRPPKSHGAPRTDAPDGGTGRAVMANGTAKRVLAGDRADWSGLLIVVEGEPDFLWVATRTRLEHAVVGIYSGAWGNNDIGRAFASRWKGARVVLATDADAAGDRYAEAIARTLPRTCRIQRRRETFA